MISENIKTLRKSIGLSQTEFGQRIGVSRDVIANIELDKIQSPEKKTLMLGQIAKEYGVTVDWILNGGPLELPDPTKAEEEARRMGELLGSGDPFVQSFIDFWCRLDDREKLFVQNKLIEFVDTLKQNQEK